MFNDLQKQYTNKDDHLNQSMFFELARRITHTEQKNLRALDYNITDLLHENHQ